MTTVIDLNKLEIPFRITNNEILDLTYWHKIEYRKMIGMSEDERKSSYLSYSRCLEEKNYEKEELF